LLEVPNERGIFLYLYSKLNCWERLDVMVQHKGGQRLWEEIFLSDGSRQDSVPSLDKRYSDDCNRACCHGVSDVFIPYAVVKASV
jgi:hypothetical protein